jgi:DNA-binding winged helix-turn-helix (wHTH) protein/TolB-like protein
MLSSTESIIYEFDSFRIDAGKRLVWNGGGEPISLTPKIFDTLLYLVSHNGTVLEKDELMSAIWPDTIVEENNLNKNISVLRHVLGESPGAQRFIVTVPGTGYKFVASVQVSRSVESKIEHLKLHNEPENNNEPETDPDLRPKTKDQIRNFKISLFAVFVLLTATGFAVYFWRQTPAKTPVKTIAILPFKPLVAENRDEALEMGMADTLIARLSNNREIIVRPLSSVRKYGNLEQDALTAGRALDVESVLDGSIQRWGDKIRVNVQLIKVADGTLLWTETFDEKFTDIFVVQDAISQRMATALALQLGGDEQRLLTKRYTENVEAFQFYVRGRFYWNKRTSQDLWKSIKHFEQSIALDPNYALAFAGLADAYALLANAGAPAHEIMPNARAAAQKAVLLDDNLAEAHTSLGRRHEEALAEMRRALEIDPLSPIFNRQYGVILLFARQYDAGLEQSKKTVELDTNFAVGHSTLSLAYRMKGSYAESVEEFAKFQELIGGKQTAALMRESFAKGGWQEFLRAMTEGRRPANLSSYNVATFHAELGEKDKAFAELNKAYENREGILGLLKVDPRFDSLHDDPRFVEIIKQINLE